MSLSVGCFRPLSVVQHGTVRKVPCGKCLSCLNIKSHKYVNLIDCEFATSDFCYFVTLTYENKYLPLLSVDSVTVNPALLEDNLSSVYRSKKHRFDSSVLCWSFSPINLRNRKYYKESHGIRSIVPVDECPQELLNNPDYFHNKFELRGKYRGFFPYLEYKDVSLFLKRVRKSLNKHNNYDYKKIRFFVCGEYGPVHMRPHWHLLFFFGKDVDSEQLRDCIRSSWQFGSIVCKLSDGGTSNYVSEYSVGTTCNSRLHQIKAFSPTVRHSTCFGEKVFEYKIKKIYELIRVGKVSTVISICGLVKNVTLPRSCEIRLYPRCFNFSHLSHSERLRLYTFGLICDKFGCYGSRRVAQSVLESMPYEVEKLCVFLDISFSDVTVDWLARILDCSNRFLENCRLYDISYEDMLCNIEIYYCSVERDSLKSFYRQQQEFLSVYGVENIHQLVHFYDNFDLPALDVEEYHFNKHELNDDLSFLFLDSLNILPFFYEMKDFHIEESEMFKESVLYHEHRRRKSLLGKSHRDKNKYSLYESFY